MTHLAYKKINAFAGVGHGFYFWNFRTDLYEPRWSYMAALERGWIPKDNLNDVRIQNACNAEDQGLFKCILKGKILEATLKGALQYIIEQKNTSGTLVDDDFAILGLSGDELMSEGGELISDFYEENKIAGVTCDFGGVAMLIEENRTVTDDDFLGWEDDEYYEVVYRGPNIVVICVLVLLAVLIGSLIGFFLAMHLNQGFNQKVRKSKMFRRISASQNPYVRKSFALPNMGTAGELERLVQRQTGSR